MLPDRQVVGFSFQTSEKWRWRMEKTENLEDLESFSVPTTPTSLLKMEIFRFILNTIEWLKSLLSRHVSLHGCITGPHHYLLINSNGKNVWSLSCLTTFEYITIYTLFKIFPEWYIQGKLCALFQITRQHWVMSQQKRWTLWSVYSFFPQELRSIVLYNMFLCSQVPLLCFHFAYGVTQVYSLCFRPPTSS